MSFTIYLSGHLKSYSGGETEVDLSGEFSNVGELLDSLWQRHLALRDRVLDEQGQVRQHVNIFVGGDDVRRREGLRTAVGRDAEVYIFNAISGG